MKTLQRSLLMLTCVAIFITGCTKSVDQKQMVLSLLKSIETGDPGPVKFINPKKYIQHNLNVGDGLAGFGELLTQLPPNSAKVNTVRIFQDGNYVFAHTKYNFFGPKIGFDIFRFENGKIVEHWDNLQAVVKKTASGRSQIDGPTEVEDKSKTKDNKLLIKNFIRDVLMGKNPSKITDYISTEQYDQHNPGVEDGLAGLGKALKSLVKAGMPMVFKKNHMILGEGNFVLAVSEGTFLKKHVAFYDLFRIKNGKIVEHWDTIEEMPLRSKWKNKNGKF